MNVDKIGVRVEQLGDRVYQLTDNVTHLTSTVERIATDAEADRALMLGMLEDMANLRQENRQILDYLMRSDRNGNGDGPQP